MNELDLLVKTLSAMAKDYGNYDERKVAEQVVIGKLKISSCYTSDMGYETAIGYNGNFYPVERYSTRIECKEGHTRWIEWARNNPKEIPYIDYDLEIRPVEVE